MFLYIISAWLGEGQDNGCFRDERFFEADLEFESARRWKMSDVAGGYPEQGEFCINEIKSMEFQLNSHGWFVNTNVISHCERSLISNKLKKTYTLILLLFIGLNMRVDGQIVNIPDTNFYKAIIASGVPDSSGYITINTAKSFTGLLRLASRNITDLTGIAAFTSIDTLICPYNNLVSLDVSSNKALTVLYCFKNKLTSLDVTSNTALTYIWCSNNSLTSLNLSKNTALKSLKCDSNSLTSLGLSFNIALGDLNCSANKLTSLDVSSNAVLSGLYCSHNKLTSLVVLPGNKLQVVACDDNQLTGLDLSFNTGLFALACNNNYLTSLDVSADPNIINFHCGYNYLTSLDLSSDTGLRLLTCYNNNLTSLSTSANTRVLSILCNKNNLTSLDLSRDTALHVLYCDSNNLTSLNMKNGFNHIIYGGGFSAKANPNLRCIEVDDSAYSTANWHYIDSSAHFSTDCHYVGITETAFTTGVNIYPNPVADEVTIETNGQHVLNIKLLNVFGQTVSSQTPTGNRIIIIDMKNESRGIYFISITDSDKNIINKKIIKQ